mmetsp:Transcript_24205/g.68582  ORF Transcript_24205/g.68582 Transcript_24205/m.68582 type:complete len:840 (-) Transcript_24205:231-2750(-)
MEVQRQVSVADPAVPVKPPRNRTIRISDVVKALEIAAERLGDIDRSCATLRAWALAGRVTPAGQVLTADAVDAGIEAWLAKKKAAEQLAIEKEQEAKEKAAEQLANEKEQEKGKEDLLSAQRKPPTPQSKRPAPVARPKAGPAASAGKAGSKAAAKAASEKAAPPPAKKARGKDSKDDATMEDRKLQRLHSEAHLADLANGRLKEVLEEINGHMEEIIRRTGPEALAKWREHPDAPDAERRELYTRLVHATPDPDVRVPEELNAELLPHQHEGLEWLASLYTNNLHGILADEMGLGKTIQTITLLLHLQETKGNRGPHLIVAPKSCLPNWEAEFAKFAPSYSVHCVTGSTEEREVQVAKLRQEVAKGRSVACITNYEQIYRNDKLLKTDWQLVVVDEGHRLKNPETVLHTAMKQLRCRMRLLLTGTPLQNGLNELWALLHYLLPELFTQLMDFKSWFSKPFQGLPGVNEFEISLDPEQEHRVIARMHTLLAPFLLQRLKKDALGDRLPPRVELTVRVPLSAWQASAYKDLEKKTIRLMDENNAASSEQINNALMQLRKIVLHPFLFQDVVEHNENLYRTSGKLEALDRLLDKLLRFKHKVLIFSQFTSMLDILEAYLKWKGIAQVRLDGQVAHELRRERMARFQADPEVPVFLLSARAGSLGLNLQAADTVVLFDLDWNPQNDKQAVARVHRVGQTKEVRVIRLLTDAGVERHMEQRCQEKLEMEAKIMGAGMFRRQATADQRRTALRAVLGIEVALATGAPATATEPIDDLTPLEEVNKLLARSDAELVAFEEVDAKIFGPESKRPSAGYTELLVSRKRLMGPGEVPAGFTGLRNEED